VVTHTWRAISFAQSFSQPPRFVASIATCDGGDSAHLRYDRTTLTKSKVQVMIEEDTTLDDETNHTDEVVHYLAIEGSGTLTGTSVSGAPGGVGYYDQSYAYGPTGNVTHKDGMGDYGYGDPAHVHAVTHINGQQRYWYDANGNMTQRVENGKTYAQTFTAENKLHSVTVDGQTTTFVYDGDGNRVKRITPEGTTYYVGGYYEVFYPAGGGMAGVGGARPGLYGAITAALGGEAKPGKPPTVVAADPGLLLMAPALGMLLVLGRRRRRYGYTRSRRALGWSVGGVLQAVAVVGILVLFTASPVLAAGPVVTKYYYAAGQRVAMRQGSEVTYLHGDHLGSTSLATNASGAKVARVLYYPYGEERYREGTLPTDFTYTGQRSEGSGLGGLMDYNARFYDVALGRFISADTIVPGAASGAGGGLATIGYDDQTRLTPLTVDFHEPQFLEVLNAENQELLQFGQPALWDSQTRQEHNVPMGPVNPQALNRYAHCLGNPLRYTDPTGHDSGGNDLIGYVQLTDDEGNPLQHNGQDIYMIWHFGEVLVVTADCPWLSDFKMYANDYADAWSDIGIGAVTLIAAGLVGLAGCITFAVGSGAEGTFIGIPVGLVLQAAAVMEIAAAGLGAAVGLYQGFLGVKGLIDNSKNAGDIFLRIQGSQYDVSSAYGL
jgi:RHS repeat-associated protein